MTKLRVTKQFDFEMAHALHKYEGKCKNIHGHTYHLNVTITGVVKDTPGKQEDGMVIDFGDLKKIIKEHIVDVYDHALVLNEAMPIVEDQFDFMNKLIIVPFQPTCENLIIHYAKILQKELPEHIELYSVFLRETPTSYAEWFAVDQ